MHEHEPSARHWACAGGNSGGERRIARAGIAIIEIEQESEEVAALLLASGGDRPHAFMVALAPFAECLK